MADFSNLSKGGLKSAASITPRSELKELLGASAAMTGGTVDVTKTPDVWYEESQQAIITIANEISSKIEVKADTDDNKIELVIQQYVDWLGYTVKELAMAAAKNRKEQQS